MPAPHGSSFFLDAALPHRRFAAEYDGEEFHSSPEDREYDLTRRTWLRDHEQWTIVVLTRHEVYGVRQRADHLLRAAFEQVKGR